MIDSQSEPRDKCVCFVLGRSFALEIGGWEVGSEERDLRHWGAGG
jgi:hypothetical protein